MRIGTEEPAIQVEPVEDPFVEPVPDPSPEPVPVEAPARHAAR